MSEEGEFKKRIYRKFIDYQLDPPQEVTQKFMICEDIEAMIEEARKEFKEWFEDFPTKDEKHYDINWNEINWEEALKIHLQEGKDLVRKWFGEGERAPAENKKQ